MQSTRRIVGGGCIYLACWGLRRLAPKLQGIFHRSNNSSATILGNLVPYKMAHTSPQPCLISPAQVVENLTYKDLIPAVEQGLGNFSKRNEEGGGGGIYPQRTMMKIEEHNGHVFVMPVVSSADNIIATKIVAIFPNNAKNNLSSHMGTIILNDATTGVPRAVMDAEHITAMRTAAASAVATKYLARDGWQTLAILGAGSQAVAHLHALKHMTTIREVRVWTRSSEKCQAFAQKFDVKACETAQEAVTGADVIATCTSSHTPVLESSWLKPSAHINCVGACVPWAQELGVEVMRKAVVYTDNTPGAYKESGDIVHSKVTVFAEIGEVINGTKEAKRDEITVFKSQGVAVEDAVAAKLVYDKVSVLKDMKS
eukprot:XP_784295.1 PREDICTED: ketimine reductase mu-crystallin isoform X1 [Strongylocentrotus purpuratus]